MEQEKFSNEMPEQVLLVPKPRRIEINNAHAYRAYGLFDTKTGTQVKDFVKGNGGTIEFDNLDPSMHYDVGVIENPDDEKPQFAIIWTQEMRDDTDNFLKNSNDLPVEFPCDYYIIDNGNNGIYDLVDEDGEKVGRVAQLTGDKPYFVMVHTFRMKDDTQE